MLLHDDSEILVAVEHSGDIAAIEPAIFIFGEVHLCRRADFCVLPCEVVINFDVITPGRHPELVDYDFSQEPLIAGHIDHRGSTRLRRHLLDKLGSDILLAEHVFR